MRGHGLRPTLTRIWLLREVGEHLVLRDVATGDSYASDGRRVSGRIREARYAGWVRLPDSTRSGTMRWLLTDAGRNVLEARWREWGESR